MNQALKSCVARLPRPVGIAELLQIRFQPLRVPLADGFNGMRRELPITQAVATRTPLIDLTLVKAPLAATASRCILSRFQNILTGFHMVALPALNVNRRRAADLVKNAQFGAGDRSEVF